jgi:PAS domain S-box-containing protein
MQPVPSGENLAKDIRTIDWAATPLGPIDGWSERLRAIAELIFYSATAACLFWGQDGAMVYNDAWSTIFGGLQTAFLGRPVAALSGQLHRGYLSRLERMEAAESAELLEALERLLQTSGDGKDRAALSCAPVVGDTGCGAGVLVQLSVAPGPEASLTDTACRREARSEFMLRFSDALYRLDDPVRIQAAASRMLGQHLGADRAHCAEFDHDAGIALVQAEYRRDELAPAMTGRHELGALGPEIARLQAGQALAIADPAKRGSAGLRFPDPARGAQLCVPVLRGDGLVACLTLTQQGPRDWTADEVATAQEAAVRLWDAVVRARAVVALHRAEVRLRLAQEAAGVGTFDWVIEANEDHWSPELLDMLGLQPGDFGGSYEDWIATIHPDDLPKAVRAIEEAMEIGTLSGEWRVVRGDGSTISVLARGVVERDAAGRPVRLTGAQVDITERVHNEQQVKFLLAELDARIEELRRDFGSPD